MVDADLADALEIESTLRRYMPQSHIVVIEHHRNRETIGPMLLERLQARSTDPPQSPRS